MSNMYMKIKGIKGSVSSKGHEGSIALTSMDFNLSRSMFMQIGRNSDREASMPSFNEVSIIKPTDESSVKLMEQVASGQAIDQVTISFCRAGDSLKEFMKYTLTNVMFSQYHQTFDQMSDAPLEHLRLNYTKIEQKYTPRDSANNEKAPIIAGYDLPKATLT